MATEIDEHLDPTNEISLASVKKRAVTGVIVLTGRTFLLSILSLVATGFLTVFLEPSEFGVFWIVSAVVNFLAYFSDVGLAAALIQKKETVTESDLKSTFTVQQFLVITLLGVLFLATPLFEKVYALNYEGKLLLYALGLSFFLSSLKTIPSVMLERKLEFGKLVIPQVLENLFYNVFAVYFAWIGLGIRSFAYAVIIRGVVGLVSMYILKPWRPGLMLHKKSIKELLKFGVPYQANTFLATIKDDGMTAVLGGILGTAGVGYLGWAQKWGQAPLRFFMDHVIKVTFPAFSRIQDNKLELTRTLERSIYFVSFLVFPSSAALFVLAPEIVQVIPRYEKWVPALLPLSLILANTLLAAVTTQLTNVLNAIGKIKITFKLMIMWTVLSWIFIPFLALRFSFVGAAFGYLVVGSSSVIAIYIARKHVYFSLTKSVLRPLFVTILMSGLLFLLVRLLPTTVTNIFVIAACGLVFYIVVSIALTGQSLINDVKRSISQVFAK